MSKGEYYKRARNRKFRAVNVYISESENPFREFLGDKEISQEKSEEPLDEYSQASSAKQNGGFRFFQLIAANMIVLLGLVSTLFIASMTAMDYVDTRSLEAELRSSETAHLYVRRLDRLNRECISDPAIGEDTITEGEKKSCDNERKFLASRLKQLGFDTDSEGNIQDPNSGFLTNLFSIIATVIALMSVFVAVLSVIQRSDSRY